MTMTSSKIREWAQRPKTDRGISLVQCATCVHFRAYDMTRNVCDAYPGGPGGFGDGDIPAEIILGEVNHDQPYRGDHGIQREEGKPKMEMPSGTASYASELVRFAYNPSEARKPTGPGGGEWTSGGAGATGKALGTAATATAIAPHPAPGREAGGAWEGRNQGNVGAPTASVTGQQMKPGELITKAQSPHSVYASLGITSFRGTSTPSMDDVTRYFSSTRFKGFERQVVKVAAQMNVQVIEEVHAAGVWEGNLEPAASITVQGADEDIAGLAKWLGSRYYQDSVMVFTPHAEGVEGGMYVLSEISDPNTDLDTSQAMDVPAALAAMHNAGLKGGRVVGHRLEIADDGGEFRPQPKQIAELARSLGLRQQYTHGRVEWLNAGEAYKKGAVGRG